jgi:hypothetical protein
MYVYAIWMWVDWYGNISSRVQIMKVDVITFCGSDQGFYEKACCPCFSSFVLFYL